MNNRWTGYLATLSVCLFLAACESGGSDTTSIPTIPTSTSSKLADSGQDACYYDYINDGIYMPTEYICLDPAGSWGPDGQDGNHSINPMSFTDNGDGTVRDNVSGLTWTKCSLGKSGGDCSSGALASYTWSTAQTQCAALGSGWRLPSVFELTRLVDYGQDYTSIDNTFFPGTGSGPYWSSTPNAIYPTMAWYVEFAQSSVLSHYQSQMYYVRCVRG